MPKILKIMPLACSLFLIAVSMIQSSQIIKAQTIQPRFGVDLAWYVSGGFGARHGVNGKDAKQLYNYLVHGHKNSGGAYGGYFTVLSYTIRTPPSYPPDWQAQKKFVLDLLSVADNDDYGQKCKIIIKLQPLCAFDDTFYGAVMDLLKTIGPVQNHPSLLGFAIRGMAPGIYVGGGVGGGGPEGADYIPSTIVYPNMPYDEASYFAKWNPLKNLVNAFGYKFGWSAGATPLNYYVADNVLWDSGDIFVRAIAPSRDSDPVKGPQKTYNNYYEGIKNPLPKQIGCVGGMWENPWYIPNTSPYYITKEKFEMAFKAFKDASAVNPQGAQLLMFYGMPCMTDDDEAFYAQYGHCPYIDWWLELCNKYGFMTDYTPSPPPETITPVTPPVITYPPYPTGVEVTLEGDPSLPKPPYSQTPPQYAGPPYTYRLFGRVVNLADGSPVAGKAVTIYYFDWGTRSWQPLRYANGTLVKPITGPDGRYRSDEIPSPPLPPTPRQQMWYYPKLEADSIYLGSEGVREDLPILPLTSPPSQQWTLTVKSDLSSVPVTVDGSFVGETPASVTVSVGSHTVEVPNSVGSYAFLHWEDGSTSPTRTINIAADTSITAYYRSGYTLADFPYPMVSPNMQLNHTIVIASSTPHGPCGGAHTMDVMGATLVAARLGLKAKGGAPSSILDDSLASYDPQSGAITVGDAVNNLIVFGGPGVNMVTKYYNDLKDELANHVLQAYFLKNAEGKDYIYVSSSGKSYFIEYDAQGRKRADYSLIELYNDSGRWVLIVAGLGGEGTWAASKVLATYENWDLNGNAVIVKYSDTNADGYLDTITVEESIYGKYSEPYYTANIGLNADLGVIALPLTLMMCGIYLLSSPLRRYAKIKKLFTIATFTFLITATILTEFNIVGAAPQYSLSNFPYPFISETKLLNYTFVVADSNGHAPCGGAHTMDVMGAILVAKRLGMTAIGGMPESVMDDYIASYDSASCSLTLIDNVHNLVSFGGPGVNMITKYYNDLKGQLGNRVLKAYFLKDDSGVDYIYVQTTGKAYYIEYDAQGHKKTDYAMIQLYYDQNYGRWVLIVAGLGGEGTWAASKVLATYENWDLSGTVAIVKYYDSNNDGYLDSITIVDKSS